MRVITGDIRPKCHTIRWHNLMTKTYSFLHHREWGVTKTCQTCNDNDAFLHLIAPSILYFLSSIKDSKKVMDIYLLSIGFFSQSWYGCYWYLWRQLTKMQTANSTVSLDWIKIHIFLAEQIIMKGKGKGRMKKMKGHLICYILTQMPSCIRMRFNTLVS